MNQAEASRTAERSRTRRSTCQSVRNPTAAGEICRAHHRSVRTTAAQRPAKSRAMRAAIAMASRRPRRNTALGADALPREPADDLAAVGVERLGVGGLEAQDQDRLGIRSAEEAPAVREGDPHAV